MKEKCQKEAVLCPIMDIEIKALMSPTCVLVRINILEVFMSSMSGFTPILIK